MRNILLDQAGELRCAYCRSSQFQHKRTTRSKAMGAGAAVTAGVPTGGIGLLAGAGTLATAKKMKCLACGQYNKTGNAKTLPAEPVRTAEQGGLRKPSAAFLAEVERSEAATTTDAPSKPASVWAHFWAGFTGKSL
ncbi:hypothetical protein AB0N05_34875 [Nocardia sp. NPDC051030]|uniref:hypothetical protein n=1 Tax=Nocardia sp. NPDC051030 TaxID=3155162 RepID=UPI003442BF9A